MVNSIKKVSNGKITVEIDVLFGKDKDTGLFLAYCPSLDLSTYTKKSSELTKSFDSLLADFMEETIRKGTFELYLLKMGWQLQVKPVPLYRQPSLDMTEIMNNMMPQGSYKRDVLIPAYC